MDPDRAAPALPACIVEGENVLHGDVVHRHVERSVNEAPARGHVLQGVEGLPFDVVDAPGVEGALDRGPLIRVT